VLQGYGLSEFGSVVALQQPDDARTGSCGRVLPPRAARVSVDGELQIRGPRFLGYLGQSDGTPAEEWWATGDRARIEADGSIRILGRRDSVIVTPMGRNISPEWIEAMLTSTTGILQAFVIGPEPSAVIGADPSVTDGQIADLVARVNADLPAYARLDHWQRLERPLTAEDGVLGPTGHPHRAALAARFAAASAPSSTNQREIPA
jgi:long-subunit acyl-CoA synthetase (AMP-forming)